jgi:hypothetical protein
MRGAVRERGRETRVCLWRRCVACSWLQAAVANLREHYASQRRNKLQQRN